ncbi:putative receptor-like protein kinase [Dorcoceras hygrometricum]|uniref:Putative receptor-like protein kinase n=1 Tax=Dorcoceras hygrometricum TaxID=472368 RepID=A0A2Z7AV00_9LAMI|nr:putative receptor-like protein kinase [Dorcoceras hygrometricum]
MKSAVTSAIRRELQCNQQLILEVSDSKTMSFGLIDTTSFCLRAKIQQMLFALITTSRKIPVVRYQSQGTSRRVYQSQDDEPVAGYNAPSRRLQCFAYSVAGNPDVGKADVVKICKPVDKESNAKK